MRRDDVSGFDILIRILSFAVGCVVGGDIAFERGVKAHAEGRYVVVQMPDGTQQVCEVKEPLHAP
jgi:hypothetical protein